MPEYYNIFESPEEKEEIEKTIKNIILIWTACKNDIILKRFSPIIEKIGIDNCLLIIAKMRQFQIIDCFDIRFLNYFRDNGADFNLKFDSDYNIGQKIILSTDYKVSDYFNIVSFLIDQSVSIKNIGKKILLALVLKTRSYSKKPNDKEEHIVVDKIIGEEYDMADIKIACAGAIMENNMYILGKLITKHNIDPNEITDTMESIFYDDDKKKIVNEVKNDIDKILGLGFDAKDILLAEKMRSDGYNIVDYLL